MSSGSSPSAFPRATRLGTSSTCGPLRWPRFGAECPLGAGAQTEMAVTISGFPQYAAEQPVFGSPRAAPCTGCKGQTGIRLKILTGAVRSRGASRHARSRPARRPSPPRRHHRTAAWRCRHRGAPRRRCEYHRFPCRLSLAHRCVCHSSARVVGRSRALAQSGRASSCPRADPSCAMIRRARACSVLVPGRHPPARRLTPSKQSGRGYAGVREDHARRATADVYLNVLLLHSVEASSPRSGGRGLHQKHSTWKSCVIAAFSVVASWAWRTMFYGFELAEASSPSLARRAVEQSTSFFRRIFRRRTAGKNPSRHRASSTTPDHRASPGRRSAVRHPPAPTPVSAL